MHYYPKRGDEKRPIDCFTELFARTGNFGVFVRDKTKKGEKERERGVEFRLSSHQEWLARGKFALLSLPLR